MSPVVSSRSLPVEPLLTPFDAQRIERVSLATIYRHYAAGIYPASVAFKLGSRIRFRPDFYRAWLRGELTEGQGPIPPPQESLETARPAAGA